MTMFESQFHYIKNQFFYHAFFVSSLRASGKGYPFLHLVAGSRVLLMEDGDQRESVVAKRKEILEFIGKEKRKRECAAQKLNMRLQYVF